MKRHEGGNTVPGGFYFNRTSWELVTVSGKEGALPEAAGAFVKVPTLVLLAGAPLFSAAYVIFLPFIGFALFFREVGRKVKETSARLATPEPAVEKKSA